MPPRALTSSVYLPSLVCLPGPMLRRCRLRYFDAYRGYDFTRQAQRIGAQQAISPFISPLILTSRDARIQHTAITATTGISLPTFHRHTRRNYLTADDSVCAYAAASARDNFALPSSPKALPGEASGFSSLMRTAP